MWTDFKNNLLCIAVILMVELGFLQRGHSLMDVHSDSYLALSAENKMARLWANIRAMKTPGHWVSFLSLLKIFAVPMCPTYQAQGDEMPYVNRLFFGWHRKKLIHNAHGTVGQVEWTSIHWHI